ncbi:2-keto-4-pentenoate hydratase/2-oxohepta-3-ene-1,7-dioic acid hydratase in catechol pathway [Actinocorallia herbida]|uniref:2-keto-4-pentenoate hydratase/2-oxohepta-3-ene-1,7-dioic acid hydratase in catechol pathway n=1 Tax=Actinocorallia herbida TaxID=58109 RepID=A0A3N1D387_9ACTN|nr:fumarylacetoacetate hydrolase family protein [Actinocorallia herbida]ROO87985.1 2-keto-4-pentenoate hydratase/2-oxohepta-3-ene-1,7-dioic acid hydratase in catechol pathway [Actinocorallia herbida]
MKIVRYAVGGVPRWGLLEDDDRIRPIRGAIGEWAPDFVASGFRNLPTGAGTVALRGVRLLAPIEPTAKILGVGANYWSHLERLGRTERPTHLASYLKPVTAVIGPDDVIRNPAITRELDYEVELTAVIGSPVSPLTNDPVPALLGYTVGNDVSAREFRKGDKGPDLLSMKANDRSTPFGPWIVTADEFPPAEKLDLRIVCRVNGEVRQEDTTRRMLWGVPEILGFFRPRISLVPGDVVLTGTTCGVGLEDGRFLRAGDLVETEIEGIGVLRNTVGEHGVLG